MFNAGDYVLADLVGFYNAAGQPVGTLRCRVTRNLDAQTVELITADLADAGTFIARGVEHVRPEPQPTAGLVHQDGLGVLS